MADFLMPSLGADMDEGTLVEWLVKPGDEVRKGDVIAVVDTDKAAIEVESFASGTVRQLIVEPGTRVPVGTVLATIGEGEQAAAAPATAEKPAKAEKPAAARQPVTEEKPPAPAPKAAKKRGAAAKKPARAGTGRRAAAQAVPAPRAQAGPELPETGSPLVRHLAEELGVDLRTVRGTGHGGVITRADIALAAGASAGPAEPSVRPAEPPAGTAAAPAAGTAAQPRERRPRVSPLARRIAADLGVDLSDVTGTGPDGAVREADVRRAAQAAEIAVADRVVPPAPQPPAPAVPAAAAGPATAQADARQAAQARLLAMRQVTARLMARSKREIPHYYLRETIDLSRAMAWLHDRNRELEVSERLVPAALLLKAAAVAARKVPALNGFWTDDHFEPGTGVHLGVAISLRGGGLVTPAIHDAADLPPAELMNRLRDLVTRARAGRLRGSELTGGTITVTNLGDQGVELVYGVIYPPQVALVGLGKVLERPVAVGGLVGARPVVITTLSADHRATDGYTGARFLTTMSELLQRPEDM